MPGKDETPVGRGDEEQDARHQISPFNPLDCADDRCRVVLMEVRLWICRCATRSFAYRA